MLCKLLRRGIRPSCHNHIEKASRLSPSHPPFSSPARTDICLASIRQISLNAGDIHGAASWLGSHGENLENEERNTSSLAISPSHSVDSHPTIGSDAANHMTRKISPSKTSSTAISESSSLLENERLGLDLALNEMKAEALFVSPWLKEDQLEPRSSDRGIDEARMAVTRILGMADDLERGVLLQKLWTILKQEDITQSLPSTTFVEILRRIEPEDDFLPLGAPYAQRIPKFQKLLRGRVDKQMQQMVARRTIVMNICRIRIRRGRQLQRKEYTQLLRCARNTYDGVTASSVMWMMLNQNMELDATCYKSLLEAKCWSDAWSPFERYNLRLYPRGKAIRRSQRGEIAVTGELSLHPYKLGSRGLGKQVPNLVSRMIRNGILADCDIIGYLITALARQGDIAGVKVALRSAWDVDVDTLGTTYRYGRKLPADSPLHPNETSLFVIAHAFGSNNDVATALRVVDFVAGKYSIEITPAVWEELMEWSYVLSTPRAKKQWPENMQPGQLPKRTPDDLWHLFTSKRYTCVPTLPMFDLKIRNQARRDTFWTFIHYAGEAIQELYREQQSYAGDDEARGSQAASAASSEIAKEQASREFLHFSYIQRWAALLLTGKRWRFGSNEQGWKQLYREFLPDIVDIFWRYRPAEGASYTTDTGHINLKEWVAYMEAVQSVNDLTAAAEKDGRQHQDPALFSFTARYPNKDLDCT